MAELYRPETRRKPGSDDTVTSLLDEYLAATREPVGSQNLFRETPNQSEQAGPRAREAGFDRVTLNESSAMTLYLVCVAALLIAALAFVFL